MLKQQSITKLGFFRQKLPLTFAVRPWLVLLLHAPMFLPLLMGQSGLSANAVHGRIGVTLQAGTHTNRFGLLLEVAAVHDQLQLHASYRQHFNASTLGPPLAGWERTWQVGALWAWGATDAPMTAWHNPLSGRTAHRYQAAYSLKWYRDALGTDQMTGLIGGQWGRWRIELENDAFGGPPADKFRTAAAALHYRLASGTQIGVVTQLWTGDPFTDFIDTQTRDPRYPGRYGYRDMSQAKYGSHSQGLLGLSLRQVMPLGQQATYLAGIDAERVRHWAQNRLFHDMRWLPDALNPLKLPHIPLVSDTGEQYLFRAGQRLRAPRPWVEMGCNAPLFY